jgi:hypothetical protein
VVFISLLMASLACYSGQIPGVFELTPYASPTPIQVAQNTQYDILETVLAPHEEGFAFFNMTVYPEPLEDSLLNSKALCVSNSPAQILFAGIGEGDITYYLVDCTGSVGWAAENRLAGPLKYKRDDLAVTVSENAQPVQMLDERTLQPLVTFTVCQPETVVTITGIRAADIDNDGDKEVLYMTECPVGTRGWLSNDQLAGPVKVKANDRALAYTPDESDFRLANEPAPVNDDNAVESECATGSVLDVKAAKRVNDTVYYNVTCGKSEGWVDQQNLVGPLRFDAGVYGIIYVEPVLIFEDELSDEIAGVVAVVEDEGTEGEGAAPEAVGDQSQRKVVQYIPPVYLTNQPGPAIRNGEDMNVVGQCASNSAADLLEYTGSNDMIYFRIACDECVQTETSPDGVVTCAAYEAREGWVEQTYLQGPIEFAPGDKVVFKASSAALETDEATGTTYARIPVNQVGAETYGESSRFDGRCPADTEVTITGVQLEKARTSNKFSFFYTVECQGQKATYIMREFQEGKFRPEAQYETNDLVTISGIVMARELEIPQE